MSTDKQAAHLARTKAAVLRFTAEQGGSCGMAQLHDFSESKYFIAHQRFSQLLEGCVGEGLIEVSSDHEVRLTEAGKTFVAGLAS